MAHRTLGLFDQDTRYRKVESLGDPLVVLKKIVLWEMSRKPLEAARGERRDARKGRRKSHDSVLMFKILVLRELYSLSDEQVEFQVADRLSFQCFLGIGIEHAVPDYSTVWRFRETLRDSVMEDLFERLSVLIDMAGFEAKKGQMLYASLVEKARTRKPPGGKDGVSLTPIQIAHRDADANWTKKHGRSYFGYKNYINAEVAHGFVRGYAVTPGSAHDSQQTKALIETARRGEPFYGDSAYRSAATTERCKVHGLKDRTMHQAQKNRPLTRQKQMWNRSRAKVRARGASVRADRRVLEWATAALHGIGASAGADRDDESHAQPAATDDQVPHRDGSDMKMGGCGANEARIRERPPSSKQQYTRDAR